jgi:hypothetical protein
MNRFFEHLIGLPINILTLGYYWMVIIDMHHWMVDSEFYNKTVIKASFSDFKKNFEKVDWKIDPLFRDSLFTRDNRSKFHASIIQINHTGYKLTTYGFIRANILKRKKIKELNLRYWGLNAKI